MKEYIFFPYLYYSPEHRDFPLKTCPRLSYLLTGQTSATPVTITTLCSKQYKEKKMEKE